MGIGRIVAPVTRIKEVGYWKDKNDVINNWNIDREFHPEMQEAEREEKLAGWEKAVKYSFGWAKN